MEFRETQAIYLQISDFVCEQILLNRWEIGNRVQSVRELGVELQVNPNTVLRAYDFLQTNNIIFNKRGVGYFVAANAKSEIKSYRRNHFLEKELPILFKNMELLEMTIDELNTHYIKYKQTIQHKKSTN